MFNPDMIRLLAQGIWETLYMTIVSSLLAYLLGLPLGILLIVTDKDGICPMRLLNHMLGFIVNFVRSVPFLILLIAVIPFTRFLVGTSVGSTATIVPLVLASAPFVARMGAGPWQVVTKVLLPEAKPSLILNAAIAATTILGYSAMSGFVGGGGLGTISINYGFYRYQSDVMLVTVLLLVVIVQVFQVIGLRVATKGDKRSR